MRSFIWVAAASLTTPAWAEAPKVVTDIAPVHSLVAQVMQGVGEPTNLVDPGASPHGYALRPSQARALSEADIVVWVGEGLTPWMEQPMEALAAKAESVELLELEATIKLEFREGATFAAHDHDEDGHEEHGHDEHEEHGHAEHEEHGHDEHEEHGHDDHEEHGHDEHEEHGHDEHEEHGHDEHEEHGHDEHEEHGHDEHEEHGDDEHHDHDHSGVDPHAWLDPANAKIWLMAIAEELSHHDPDNAATYAKNAAEGVAQMDQLIAELSADLAPAHDLGFVVFHDAYHYFESRFDLAATGAISLGDASDPSAARVAEVREAVHDLGVTCVFAEPQFNPGLIKAVSESGVTVAEIDPLGVGVEMGPNHYAQTLRALSNSILGCLK
jgi:zinc transport system substrate-binding protein